VGLWQESGAMQRHKFLGEAAEAPEIIILMVLLYIKSRVGLISRKKEADTWPGILKGCRESTSQAQ